MAGGAGEGGGGGGEGWSGAGEGGGGAGEGWSGGERGNGSKRGNGGGSGGGGSGGGGSGGGGLLARVEVTLKAGVLDPQGEAVRHALGALGFSGIEGVRIGKVIELRLAARDRDAAEAEVARMCERLLANTTIESYRVELV